VFITIVVITCKNMDFGIKNIKIHGYTFVHINKNNKKYWIKTCPTSVVLLAVYYYQACYST